MDLGRFIGTPFAETQQLRALRRRAGNVPYGYRYVRGSLPLMESDRIEADEAEAEVVRTVFRMRATGASLLDIAEILNQAAAPRRHTSRPWRKSDIHHLLNNKAYLGDPQIGMPALISRELWRRAHRIEEGGQRFGQARQGNSGKDDLSQERESRTARCRCADNASHPASANAGGKEGDSKQ